VKKQGKVKLLKINELKSRGSPVRRKKMLKMQDDPTKFMKTQGRATECRSRNRTFSIRLERFRRHYGRFSSLAGAINWGRTVKVELSPPSVRAILRRPKVSGHEVSILRLEPSRNQQVRFAAVICAVNVLAPKGACPEASAHLVWRRGFFATGKKNFRGRGRGPTKGPRYGRCAEKKNSFKYVRGRNVHENKG